MKRNPKDDPELRKAAGEDEDEGQEEREEEGSEDEDEEEGEMEKTKKAKKSIDLDEDDLQKSLDKLVEMAGSGDTVTRKQALLSKAQTEELTKSEQAELFNLLGGGSEDIEDDLGDEITKGLEENDTLQKALDVSDYLQENHTELVKALRVMGEALTKSDNRQHEYNLVLAKAMSEMGRHIVAMSERLGVIEGQPARAPKSRGAIPMAKSFVNQEPAGEGLSKSQILDAMDEMTQDSFAKGMSGSAPNGEDLSVAISKYEQFNTMTPSMLAQVKAHIESKGATTH